VKTFQEQTNAENKSIGFDYQYYYFLYLLLCLEEGEKIGLEVKDDVHLELPNEKQVLLQLKHSIQTNGTGVIINLTERDSDLWKTLYNWVNIINDPIDGREKEKTQLNYLKKTAFILVSNKAFNSSNKFLENVSEFKKGLISISDFQKYLDILRDTTKDKEVCSYISILRKQSPIWLSEFLKKLEFELGQDDLISKIKSKIKSTKVKEEKIEDVFNAIDSNLRKKNYIDTKSRKKIIFSFDDFYKEYSVYFDKGRNNKLPIRKKNIKFNKPMKDQTFIKQLLDIFALKEDDHVEMLRLTSQMLQTGNHIEDWVNRGLIVQEQVDEFNNDCVNKWKNTHDEVHREINLNLSVFNTPPTDKEIILAALKCLDEIKKKELEIDYTELDTELSNGQFYLLSDKSEIGWRIGWEEKYKL